MSFVEVQIFRQTCLSILPQSNFEDQFLNKYSTEIKSKLIEQGLIYKNIYSFLISIEKLVFKF